MLAETGAKTCPCLYFSNARSPDGFSIAFQKQSGLTSGSRVIFIMLDVKARLIDICIDLLDEV
jgi:hypothetical protein